MDNDDSLYAISFTRYSTLPTYIILAFNQFWLWATQNTRKGAWKLYAIKVRILEDIKYICTMKTVGKKVALNKIEKVKILRLLKRLSGEW